MFNSDAMLLSRLVRRKTISLYTHMVMQRERKFSNRKIVERESELSDSHDEKKKHILLRKKRNDVRNSRLRFPFYLISMHAIILY